jgi:hypothetical protein
VVATKTWLIWITYPEPVHGAAHSRKDHEANQPLGFDLESSPFGNDSSDIFALDTDLNYEDAFTDHIFYKPL